MVDKQNPIEVIRDGIPTGPEVQMLMRAFPDLKAGDFIEYDKIGEVVTEQYGSSRFKTVLSAWRRALQETGVVTDCVPSRGVRVLTDSEVIALAYSGVRSARRKVTRTARKLNVIRPTEERLQTELHHSRQMLAHVGRSMKDAEQKLLSAPKVVPLPARRAPDATK